MKRYFIPLILILLFGCTGGKPHLSVSFLPVSMLHPYEGDEMTLSINIANTGAAEAKDFTVDIFVNNVSLKTEVLTLQPNSNSTVLVSWYPFSGGEYDVVAKVDPGNLVTDASADKEASTHVSVSPAEQLNLFSAVPARELRNVGIINVTRQGIRDLNSYMPAMSGISNIGYLAFVRAYLNNFKEVQIGSADYVDGRHAIAISIKGAISPEQIASIFSTFIKSQTTAGVSLQNKIIDGANVTILTSDALSDPVCVWRERGWLKVATYLDPTALETCGSVFGRYNTSYVESVLSVENELAREPPFNTTLLGSMLHVSNITNSTVFEYGAAFEDEGGFYGYYVTKQDYKNGTNVCIGTILNRSMMQICETPPINSTWAAVQRKVGNYSIACLSTPKTGDLTAEIETKALDLCYSFNYSGEERTWISVLSFIHERKCELPDNFSCLSYNFSNNTLDINLTQNSGRAVVLNGFGCSSQKNASTVSFQLPQPLTLPSNSSVMLSVPCYNASGGVRGGNYTYFDSELYLNYSIGGSSESKVIVGNLTIRKI
jgi:hypothetical protein